MFQRRFMYDAATLCVALTVAAGGLMADDTNCANLPGYSALQAALASATATETSGLNNQMWATIVDRDGYVCAVAFSGVNRGAQWPGSRVISAQKANTANAFSLDSSSKSGGSGQAAGLALSTANLYSAVQPGGSLFGLQASNPVNESVGYTGPSTNYEKANDPMVGNKIGGVNVFGGGLALYATGGVIIGGVGVSGDTSCADHMIAWRVRNKPGARSPGKMLGASLGMLCARTISFTTSPTIRPVAQGLAPEDSATRDASTRPILAICLQCSHRQVSVVA